MQGLTKKQLKLKKSGIGASEIATIAGINPYKTPLDLWLEKTGRTDSFEGNEYTELGTYFEKIIAQWYSRRHGVKLVNPRKTLQHPDIPFILATPDRLVVEPSENLEIKTVWSDWAAKQWGPSGTDEVPEAYILQVHWQMIVLEALHMVQIKDQSRLGAFIAPAVGSEETAKRDYVIPISRPLQARLIEMAREFWGYVESDQSPPLAPGEDACKLYPKNKDNDLITDQDVAGLVLELMSTKEQAKELEIKEQELRSMLTARIADRAGLIGTWGKVTWKNNKSSEKFDYKQALKDGQIPQQVLERYTSIIPGPRVLRTTLRKDNNNE